MTHLPSISVVVVSWKRPADLRRCLVALQQQDHPALEIRVVVEPEAVATLRQTGLATEVTANPGGNISAARNIGLRRAQGDVVAFIDDDAVAEPTWARRLAEAFHDPAVVVATGYTRGRNGISMQWTATEVDATGFDHAMPPLAASLVRQGSPTRAVKPVGTNCAFRRSAVLQAGGFDEAYRFYLEDADIGLRLARFGATAVVPGAQVHHGFAASERRRADRVPTDLAQIGASAQVFLRRHADPSLWPGALARLRAEQAERLARHRAAKRITMAEMAELLASLETGITEGETRALRPLAPMVPQPPAKDAPRFSPVSNTGPRQGMVIAGRIWQAHRLRARAKAAAQAGFVVTLFLLSPTPRAHRHSFHTDGYWEQTGGLFGPSDRTQPRVRWWRFGARIAAETTRIAPFRPVFG